MKSAVLFLLCAVCLFAQQTPTTQGKKPIEGKKPVRSGTTQSAPAKRGAEGHKTGTTKKGDTVTKGGTKKSPFKLMIEKVRRS